MRSITISILLLLIAGVTCCISQPSSDWRTDYEKSGYLRTPRYRETIEFCKRLARGSPWVMYESFGTSPEGRDLPLVIVSNERAFTPAAARKTGKAVILIQSGIHAGEIDGKDASLMMIRDIAITKTERRLLEHAILLFVPIFNVDGHERFGPFNRINQNGPEEMGWRVTAQNLNLNRDYMKADAQEMRAMLRLFSSWLPDVYVDCHVTDGADFQYDITYSIDTGPNVNPAVSRWVTGTFLPAAIAKVESSGHRIFPYVAPREDNDIGSGLRGDASPPRFSTGYATLQNRPALLIETHMLKPYRTRVDATYQLLKALVEIVDAAPGELRAAVRHADDETVRTGLRYDPRASLPIRLGLSERSELVRFLGYRTRTDSGEISGAPYVSWTHDPVTLTVPYYGDVIVLDSVSVPLAYILPPEWTSVRDVLNAHGIVTERLTGPAVLRVESYRFSDVGWNERPYEGRQTATFKTEVINEQRTYPAGSFVIRTAQRAAKVAMNLLEPRSADSFVSWGFFNAIFEQKEYVERYVMESAGRKLLADDPLLKAAFEEKVRTDTAFAKRPAARINWLYLRSPWTDTSLNKYPVGRIISPVVLKTSTP